MSVIFEVIPPRIHLFNNAGKSRKKWSFSKVTENLMSLRKYLICGGSRTVAFEKILWVINFEQLNKWKIKSVITGPLPIQTILYVNRNT